MKVEVELVPNPNNKSRMFKIKKTTWSSVKIKFPYNVRFYRPNHKKGYATVITGKEIVLRNKGGLRTVIVEDKWLLTLASYQKEKGVHCYFADVVFTESPRPKPIGMCYFKLGMCDMNLPEEGTDFIKEAMNQIKAVVKEENRGYEPHDSCMYSGNRRL